MAETLTTKQAAKALGVAVGTFRKYVKTNKIDASGSVETGKRGRPALLWAASTINKLKKA
jgi:excisionase family DNA binding protein